MRAPREERRPAPWCGGQGAEPARAHHAHWQSAILMDAPVLPARSLGATARCRCRCSALWPHANAPHAEVVVLQISFHFAGKAIATSICLLQQQPHFHICPARSCGSSAPSSRAGLRAPPQIGCLKTSDLADIRTCLSWPSSVILFRPASHLTGAAPLPAVAIDKLPLQRAAACRYCAGPHGLLHDPPALDRSHHTLCKLQPRWLQPYQKFDCPGRPPAPCRCWIASGASSQPIRPPTA